MNQRGLAQWIVIVILAIALPATLLLVRQTQIFKPKAFLDQSCINNCNNTYTTCANTKDAACQDECVNDDDFYGCVALCQQRPENLPACNDYYYDICEPSCNVTPSCNASPVCSGACNARYTNTCQTNNGNRTCDYTTYTGGGSCYPHSFDQDCTIDACASGFTCSNGNCIETSAPPPPPPSGCSDQLLYNQCVGCDLSEAVYQNSCTGAYSIDSPAPDYTGGCSGSQYCGTPTCNNNGVCEAGEPLDSSICPDCPTANETICSQARDNDPNKCWFDSDCPGAACNQGNCRCTTFLPPPPPPPPPTGGPTGVTVSISPTGSVHVYVNNPYDIAAYAIGNNLNKIEIWARKEGGTDQIVAFADDFVNPSPGSLGDLERSPPSQPLVAGQGAIESGCRGQYLTPGGPLLWSCWAYNVKWRPSETGNYTVYLKVSDINGPVCDTSRDSNCSPDPGRVGNAGTFTANVTSGKFRAEGLKNVSSGGFNGVFVNCVEDPNGGFGSFYECAGSYDIYCCSSGCQRMKNQFTGLDDSCWLQQTNACISILTSEGNSCGPAACYSFGFPGGVQCVTSGIYGGGGVPSSLPPGTIIQGPNGPIYSGGGYPPGYVPGGGTGGGAICPPVLYGKPSSGGVYTPDPGLFCGYYMPAGGNPASINYVKNIGIAWDAGSGAGAQCSGAQSWKATVDGSPLTGLDNSACFNVLNATFANKAFPATDNNQNHTFTVTAFSDSNCSAQLGSPATITLNSGPACPTQPPANPTVLYRCESSNQCVAHPIGQLLGGYSLLSGCQANCGGNQTSVPPPPPPPPSGTSPQSVRIINVSQGQCNDNVVSSGRLFATNSSQSLLIRNSDGTFSLNQSWDVTTSVGSGTGTRTVCARFYSDTSAQNPLGSSFSGDINYNPSVTPPPPPPAAPPPPPPPVAPPPPPSGGTCTQSNGDANRDGRINGQDFTIWSNEFLSNTHNQADFNCDGRVNGQDFTIWSNAFLAGR